MSLSYSQAYAQQAICPFGCSNSDVKISGICSTLVGWFGGDEKDPNHHSGNGICNNCQKEFTVHFVISKNSFWYCNARTSDLIMGDPVCCKGSFKKI